MYIVIKSKYMTCYILWKIECPL